VTGKEGTFREAMINAQGTGCLPSHQPFLLAKAGSIWCPLGDLVNTDMGQRCLVVYAQLGQARNCPSYVPFLLFPVFASQRTE
jgi:hypothetical protein